MTIEATGTSGKSLFDNDKIALSFKPQAGGWMSSELTAKVSVRFDTLKDDKAFHQHLIEKEGVHPADVIKFSKTGVIDMYIDPKELATVQQNLKNGWSYNPVFNGAIGRVDRF